MEILIDTNFAITCTKQKIDFFNLISQIVDESVNWVIPEQVMIEIQRFTKDPSETIKDRQAAKLFLDILDNQIKNDYPIKMVKLDKLVVDNAIVDYCKKNPLTVLATLDKKLKSRVTNNLLMIKGKKFLKIQKDINSP
jgi:rRNA-processing protein FCF1